MGKIFGLCLLLTMLSFGAKADGLAVYELDQQPVFVDSSHQKKLTYQAREKNPEKRVQHKKVKVLEKWRHAFKKTQLAKKENRRARSHAERV